MKTFCLSLVMSSSLLACKESAPAPSQQFGLVLLQTTTLPIAGAGQATLTELADSRCPSNAMCIWAGTIAATVVLADGSQTQTARLGYQRPYTTDSAAVVLAGHRYWLRLLDARPYPSTTNGNVPRTAYFRLRPQ